MKFDLLSFLLGFGTCAGTVFLGGRLRSLLLEVATVIYRFLDSVAVRAARQDELENLLAKARVRVRDLPRATRRA